MNTLKPEAVLLAEYLEQFRSFPNDLAAAAELRRLYAENIELRKENDQITKEKSNDSRGID